VQRARAEDKKEFEASLAKHVGFIDTIMADKKALAQQVTALTDQLSLIASTTEKKVKMLTDQHQFELTRAREQWEASDKVCTSFQAEIIRY
jgi:5-azacytidine-induced protein 1